MTDPKLKNEFRKEEWKRNLISVCVIIGLVFLTSICFIYMEEKVFLKETFLPLVLALLTGFGAGKISSKKEN